MLLAIILYAATRDMLPRCAPGVHSFSTPALSQQTLFADICTRLGSSWLQACSTTIRSAWICCSVSHLCVFCRSIRRAGTGSVCMQLQHAVMCHGMSRSVLVLYDQLQPRVYVRPALCLLEAACCLPAVRVNSLLWHHHVAFARHHLLLLLLLLPSSSAAAGSWADVC